MPREKPVRRTTIRISTTLAALSLLIAAPAANAAVEQGDAGDLPATAQDLSSEVVERIDGLADGGLDVDMYRLCLTGGRTFSASTVGGSDVDTQLFLFDSNGRGVYANDDSDGMLQSRLPAGHALTPQDGGEYLLAVAVVGVEPVNSSRIFPPNPSGVVGPTEAGGPNPVTRWAQVGRERFGGDYTISLTGADCEPNEDVTPPTINLSSPVDGAVVPRGETVTVVFSCADEDGGSGLSSCVGTVANGGSLDTSELGPESVTVTARDNAGNQRSVTHTVTVVEERDTTPPAIELLSPLDGAVYLLKEEVFADYGCSDGGSGLASCVGPVADGAPVDTSTVGPHEFTVEAADRAGNTSAATARYQVIYDFDGFLWPVRNPPRVNKRTAGSAVPIRFILAGRLGLDVIEEGWPQVAEVDCDFSERPESGDAVEDPKWFKHSLARWRRTHYFLYWKTDKKWAGSCRQFMLKLSDGTVKRANFEFRSKHGNGHGHDDDDDDDRGGDDD
jgi:HYR domain